MLVIKFCCVLILFFSIGGRQMICALVTGVQTGALPICGSPPSRQRCCSPRAPSRRRRRAWTHASKPRCRRTARRASRSPSSRTGKWCTRRGTAYASRSEEHTSELQSLMRISYAVFCLKKKKKKITVPKQNYIQTTDVKYTSHHNGHD